MPRRSAASMAITAVVEPVPTPTPPAELTALEQERWLAFVTAKPVDWFDSSSLPLLTQLVRHLSTLDKLNVMVEAHCGCLEDYDRLLKMRTRESAATKALATALRLTVQSRYNAQRAYTINQRGGRNPSRPWDDPTANVFARNGVNRQ